MLCYLWKYDTDLMSCFVSAVSKECLTGPILKSIWDVIYINGRYFKLYRRRETSKPAVTEPVKSLKRGNNWELFRS
jgi:hypothetical protein